MHAGFLLSLKAPDMHLLLDQLGWGNPSHEDSVNLRTTNYLTPVLATLKKRAPFLNSSEATREELQQLLAYGRRREDGARRHIFDSELVPYINDLFCRNGCELEQVTSITKSIVADVLPVITQLKYYFQRPRPAQLAYYLKIPLHPNFSRFVSSPSYPSGHSVLAGVLTEALAHEYSSIFGDCYQIMRKFSGEVMESRLYMGVHYPSDNTFALSVCQAILQHPGFIEKYLK